MGNLPRLEMILIYSWKLKKKKMQLISILELRISILISSSKIMAYEMEEIKNVKELIKKVISLQTFSEELMELIYEKEKEER